MAEVTQFAEMLRSARLKAGLSQRELARRAGTAQSVVTRLERGLTSPTLVTFHRLLAAAGFELRAKIEPSAVRDESVLADIPRVLALSPDERLLEVRNVSRFVSAARRV